MDDLVARARGYAVGAHARINQLRKYTRQPYDVHLRAVADLVAAAGGDPAMVAAAWLHDTVEDTPATFEEIEREFGADVAGLVRELTDVSRPGDGNRAARKAIDREHLAAASPRAMTVKLADIVDNCEDICRHDAKFGRVYLGEAKALLAVLGEGDPGLRAKAAALVAACETRLGAAPGAAHAAAERGEAAGGPGRGDRHGIRLFMEAFTARDILEPLRSFDEEAITGLPPGAWPGRDLAVAGVRRRGTVSGYLLREDLATAAGPQVREIERRQCVDLDASLAEVIHVLTLSACCFVELGGEIVGVVTRGDIGKPVVRMWLFGIVILVETQVVERVRAQWPGEAWTALVSPGRLEKARQLQAERLRRGLPADLLDCLQFSDKLQLAIQAPGVTEALGFASTGAAKKVVKDLESLRNNLAHGQDITVHDWPQIARLARRVQQRYGS